MCIYLNDLGLFTTARQRVARFLRLLLTKARPSAHASNDHRGHSVYTNARYTDVDSLGPPRGIFKPQYAQDLHQDAQDRTETQGKH